MKKSQLQAIIREEIRNILEAEKAKKDYDGDGKIESPSAEYKGSKDKAIKKNMSEDSKEDPTMAALQKKVNDLAKAAKKVPDELKGKLAKKIKTAQADIDSYKDSLKPKKENE